MPFFGLDMQYMIYVFLPAMVLAGIASFMVKTTFARYSKVRCYSGMTGAQAAERMMRSNGVFDVRVEQVGGFLSDHYDPSQKVLRLSPDVYNSNSLAAVGVACHEAGHALQHANQYVPLVLRTVLVPVTNISSMFAFWVLAAGVVFRPLLYVGVAMFAIAFLFSVVTLPVEWDASARAKAHLVSAGIVSPAQEAEAGRVLNAAFLTYIAAAVSSLLTLLYYLLRSGLIGGNNRD